MGLAHGWGRDVFSMAFALQNLVWGGACIFMGILADRYGSGRTIALGAVLYMLGMIGTRFATDETTLYLTAGVLVGLGQAGTTFPVILPVVARSVPPAYRSTAMGIASAGGSMGQFAVVPTGQVLINGLDWPGALWCCPVRGLRRAAGLLPARSSAGPCGSASIAGCGGASGRAASVVPFPVLELLRLRLPYRLHHAAPAGLCHRRRPDGGAGATAIALIGLFNVLGSFYAGKLGGKYSKKRLLAVVYGMRAFGILLLLWLPLSSWVLYVFAAWMGLFWLGTVPLTQGLIGQIYGLRYAATLSGIVFLGHQLGSFVGVWLGGYAYAKTGNYDMVWWLGVVLAVLAALLCLPVREQPVAQPAAA